MSHCIFMLALTLAFMQSGHAKAADVCQRQMLTAKHTVNMNDAETSLIPTFRPVNKNHRMFKDITGMVFGRLTAVRCLGATEARKTMWLCKCACGKKSVVQAS